MAYRSGSHTLFHHRYHIVWGPKYRYKVLIGDVRLRVRDIVRQVCPGYIPPPVRPPMGQERGIGMAGIAKLTRLGS